MRALAWPVAAAHGIGYAKFLILDLPSVSLWASLWVLLGWWVGARWRAVAEETGTWVTVGGVALVALAAMPLAIRLWRGRTRRPPPPR